MGNSKDDNNSMDHLLQQFQKSQNQNQNQNQNSLIEKTIRSSPISSNLNNNLNLVNRNMNVSPKILLNEISKGSNSILPRQQQQQQQNRFSHHSGSNASISKISPRTANQDIQINAPHIKNNTTENTGLEISERDLHILYLACYKTENNNNHHDQTNVNVNVSNNPILLTAFLFFQFLNHFNLDHLNGQYQKMSLKNLELNFNKNKNSFQLKYL